MVEGMCPLSNRSTRNGVVELLINTLKPRKTTCGILKLKGGFVKGKFSLGGSVGVLVASIERDKGVIASIELPI